MSQYDHKDIEPKWQKFWEENKTFRARESSEKEKFYVLDMFPYPSGAGLHVGHPEGYTATDIISRFERMRGKEVLHPMGWDAFGLPAENFALKTGTHPAITTAKNIENFTRQIKSLGFSYDWDREVNTTDPEYFKWTQWIFLQLFNSYFDEETQSARPISELMKKFESDGTFAGKSKKEKSDILAQYRLAYEDKMPINFCPSCKTGLANEEVVNGKCDRCGAEVTRKNLRQWVLRITKYAERLLNDLETLNDWPEKIIAMQRNWIGKSTGTEVDFEILPNTKKGEQDPVSGGHSKGAQRVASFSENILAKETPIVKMIRTPKRFLLSKFFGEREADGKKIIFHGKKLFRHFGGKDNREIKFRAYFAKTVFSALSEIKFDENLVGYFQVKSSFFCVILEKNSDNTFSVKTFYRAKKLSKNLKPSQKITVFTTRLDTIFSGTFLVLAPEHPLVAKITTPEQKPEIEKYLAETAMKSDLERTDLAKDKSGAFTGAFATNPATGDRMPIWIADFVLLHYGTGAVFADAHDERDFEIAKKFNIPLKVSLLPENADDVEITAIKNLEKCFSEKGVLINSAQFDGMKSDEAIPAIRDWLAGKGAAVEKVNYKLRDWIFSRQRYWGEPIPIIHCEKCGVVPISPLIEYEKKGAVDRQSEDASCAGSCVRRDTTPIYTFILGKNYIPCKSKSQRALQKIKIFKNAPKHLSSSLGSIKCDWGNIARHFCKKKNENIHFYMRAKWRDVVVEILQKGKQENMHYEEEKVGYVLRGIAKNGEVITVVLGIKNENEYFLKTFFAVETLSKKISPFLPHNALPLCLPEVECYEPSGTGESPLATIPEFVNCTCPECGEKAKRETNTMPQWAGSSWYWLRFMDPKNDSEFCAREKEKFWGPVDLYVGGAEHAVLHLLYARFWHKVLFDLGFVSTVEPFKKLMNQGLILAEDGQKMSKSLGNVVNPDEIVEQYGADTLRIYEMFMGPFEQNKAWSTGAVGGIHRFLSKIWTIFSEKEINKDVCPGPEFRRLVHKTIKKVTEDIENFKFNTAISQMMILVNAMQKVPVLPMQGASRFCRILSPFAPHLAEEIWHECFKNEKSIASESWPEYDPELAKDKEIQLAIQVNGKLRATIPVSADIAKDDALAKARENENVLKFTEEKEIVKEIFVPGKIVNLVVK